MHRALLMTLYGTGMRRTEVSMHKVRDIDSRRMMTRVERGKGGDSRDLSLSPALLETLREYWRWKKPRIYLFPSRIGQRDQDRLISDKTRIQTEGARNETLFVIPDRCDRLRGSTTRSATLCH